MSEERDVDGGRVRNGGVHPVGDPTAVPSSIDLPCPDASARRPRRSPLPFLALMLAFAVACGATPSDRSTAGERVTASGATPGTSSESGDRAEPGNAADDLYAPWAQVLSDHVDGEGLVDYRGLKESPDDLAAFMEAIARVDPAGLPDDDARIAFWINAYNAKVLHDVVERYPIDSVRDVGALWGLVGGFFEQESRIAGRDLHLDDIEHGILRAEYPDPRIHWALVCGAFGCPRLIRRPYRASDLGRILDERTDEFLSTPRGLQIDRSGEILWLSRYFDWYAEDFEAASGAVPDYLIAEAPDEAAAWIREHRDTLVIRYMDYDWTLNDRAKGPRTPPRPF